MEEVYVKVSELELRKVVTYFERENKDIVSIWDLVNAIDDLLNERDELDEQNEILKENQRGFNPYREYGVSEHDFH